MAIRKNTETFSSHIDHTKATPAFGYKNEYQVNGKGDRKGKTILQIDPEDIVAAGAVLIAVMLAAAMIFGAVPINKYTTAIITLSGGGAVVAGIVKARRGKETYRSPWLERGIWSLVVVGLVVVFGAYVWVTR